MTNVKTIPEHPTKTFTQEISKVALLEVSFMDFGSDSVVTAVKLLVNAGTPDQRAISITKRIFRSKRLLHYCTEQMRAYILITKQDAERDDERWLIAGIDNEEFRGVRLDDEYQTFTYNAY